MRKKIYFLSAILLCALAYVAYAHTNTTTISRSQLAHPDLGYEGGSSLHDAIAAIYSKLGDNANARYASYTSQNNSTTVTYTHNFGVDYSELRVYLYTGTTGALTRVNDPAASGWTIAANLTNPTTQIDVTTPASGQPHNFAIIVVQGAGEPFMELRGQTTEPATPASGDLRMFATDNSLKVKDSLGVVSDVGAGAGGGSGVNLLVKNNWDFEKGDNGDWTKTGSSVFTITEVAGEVGFGTKSGSWDASASGEYLTSAAITIPNGLKGKLCVLEINYNGGDDNIDFYAWDGSSKVGTAKTLVAATGWVVASNTFVCGDSGTIAARFESTADAASIDLDNIHLGVKSIVSAIDPRWPSYDESEVTPAIISSDWATPIVLVDSNIIYKTDSLGNDYIEGWVNFTHGSDVNGKVYIPSITFKTGTNQSCSARGSNYNVSATCEATNGTNYLTIGYGSGQTSTSLYFKSQIDSKPIWATKNAPDVYLAGMPDTDALGGDWEAFTPTLEATTTNPTIGTGYTQQGFARRVGDSLEIQATIRFGTSGMNKGSGTYVIPLPNGLTVDSDKINAVAVTSILGWAELRDDNTSDTWIAKIAYNSGTGYIYMSTSQSTSTGNVTDVYPFTFAAQDAIRFTFTVPIQGWTTKEYLANAITGFNTATADKPGLLSATAQNVGGAKTFQDEVVLGDSDDTLGGYFWAKRFRLEAASTSIQIDFTYEDFKHGYVDMFIVGGYNSTNREGFRHDRIYLNRNAATLVTVQPSTNQGGTFSVSSLNSSSISLSQFRITFTKPTGADYYVLFRGQNAFSKISSVVVTQ